VVYFFWLGQAYKDCAQRLWTLSAVCPSAVINRNVFAWFRGSESGFPSGIPNPDAF
jgi:hypothetical protein